MSSKPTLNSQTIHGYMLAMLCFAFACTSPAAELFWDANGATAGVGGTGTWTGGSTWRAGSDTGTLQAWADGNSARFSATAAITLNANVATPAITNTGGNVAQIIGSGGNTIDFGAGGFFVSGGNTISMRSSAPFKGNVTLVPTSGTLAQTVALWLKADNTLLINTTVFGNGALSSILVDHVGALGTSASSLLITNSAVVQLGALTTEPVGSAANNGSGGGLVMNAVTNTIGGGYIRSRAGSNTLTGPITLTAAGSGFITRAAAGVALTLASTATLDLGANTLNLNVASASSGVFINSVVSGTGGMQTVGVGTVASGADGTGTTTLNAANTFSGTATTAQNLGTLALGNVNALQNATLDTGSASGSQSVTFVVAGNNTYNLGALTGSDALAIGGNTISVGSKAVDTTFSAAISGSGGKLTKVGANKLTLNAANSYDGVTTVSNGTLALGASGSLAAGAGVSIASGTTFDVSAIASYSWGASASLAAAGTVSTPAVLKGGTMVDLGTRPVSLTYTPDNFAGDANSPALNISQGALTLNGGITVVNNGGTALGAGTYTLISQAVGSISGTPTLSGAVGGSGIEAGKTAFIQVSGSEVQLVVQGALPTTTDLFRTNSTPSSSTYGDTLQFGVAVSPTVATGTVELRDGGPSGTLVGSGSLSSGVAVITPAPNALTAGSHANLVALYLGDVNYQASSSAALSPAQAVGQKIVTVTGASADNKYFDGTTSAIVSGGALNGVLAGDAGNVTLNQSGVFVSAGPGTAIAVTGTLSLTGSASGNYSLTQPSLAADIYDSAVWTGTAADTFWNTAGNWLTNTVPAGANVVADLAQLDITTDQTVNLNSARTIGKLAFGDADTGTAAGWTLANNGSGANILTLAGTMPTVTVNALGTDKRATISAVVTGTSGLTKSGAGTLALTGANTYTGGTTVSNGWIHFNFDSGFGTTPVSATPGNIVLDGGGIALISANQSLSANRGVALGANGGAISNAVSGSGNLTVNGIIAGSGALIAGSASSAGLLLSGQNTYSGGTVLVGPSSATMFNLANTVGTPGSLVSGNFGTGPIVFNGPGMRSSVSLDTTNGNAIIFAADATFPTLASEKTLTFDGPVTLSNSTRVLTVNIGATVAGKSLVINNVIGDGGNGYGLTKAGTGVLTLTRTNTYSGTTTITGGSIVVLTNGALGTVGAPTTVSSGASLGLSAMNYTSAEPISIAGSGVTAANHFFSGSIGSRGALQGVTGNSTWAGSVTNTANDTRIGVQDGANMTISGNITDGGAGLRLVFRHGTTTAGSITLSGAGNNWTGGSDIFGGAGAVILGADNALGSGLLRVGTTSVGAVSTLDLNGNDQTSAGLSQAVDATVGIIKNDGAQASLLTLNPSSGQIYRGIIQDGTSPVAVTINGSATQTFTGANNYSGATTVSGGTLRLSSSGSLAATSAVTVNGTGTLGGEGTVNGAVTIQSGGTLAPGTPVGLLTLASTLSFNSGATAHFDLTNGLAADKAAVAGAVTYAGKLKLERVAGATLSYGSYDLFDGASFSGAFTQLELVNWDVTKRVSQSSLTTDGTIVLSDNAAPVAQNLTIGVAQGGTATLLVIGGKNAPTDADGDALSVTAVGTPTSGAASFSSTSVTYVASGSTGTNTFTYTVADAFGASDTKTVTVVVTSPEGFNKLSGPTPNGGLYDLTYLGIPGYNYALDESPDLIAPYTWYPVTTNTAGASGTIIYTVPLSYPSGSFRTRYVP